MNEQKNQLKMIVFVNQVEGNRAAKAQRSGYGSAIDI